MMRRLRYGVSVIAIGVAFAVGGLGIQQARAALPPDVQSQVVSIAAQAKDAMLKSLVDLAKANPAQAADIAAAAARASDADLADEIVRVLIGVAPEATVDIARAVCRALAEEMPHLVLEACADVVAVAITVNPGAAAILEEEFLTALGDPTVGPEQFIRIERDRDNEGIDSLRYYFLGDFFRSEFLFIESAHQVSPTDN